MYVIFHAIPMLQQGAWLLILTSGLLLPYICSKMLMAIVVAAGQHVFLACKCFGCLSDTALSSIHMCTRDWLRVHLPGSCTEATCKSHRQVFVLILDPLDVICLHVCSKLTGCTGDEDEEEDEEGEEYDSEESGTEESGADDDDEDASEGSSDN